MLPLAHHEHISHTNTSSNNCIKAVIVFYGRYFSTLYSNSLTTYLAVTQRLRPPEKVFQDNY